MENFVNRSSPHLPNKPPLSTTLNPIPPALNSAISRIEKEIVLLQQYRAALISEVVIGKISVI